MDELVVDGEKYISSKRAARLSGYAKDYIGQLCRGGKIEAKMVGRSWYVKESAITEHRKTFQGEAVVDDKLWVSGKNGLEFQGFGAAVSAPKAPLPEENIKINYESDSRPLMPALAKKEPLRIEEDPVFVPEPVESVPLRRDLEEDVIHYPVREVVSESAKEEVMGVHEEPVVIVEDKEEEEATPVRDVRRHRGYRLKLGLVFFFVLIAVLMLFEGRSVYTATPEGFKRTESGIAILSLGGDLKAFFGR